MCSEIVVYSLPTDCNSTPLEGRQAATGWHLIGLLGTNVNVLDRVEQISNAHNASQWSTTSRKVIMILMSVRKCVATK